jgi:hypothetical protein
MLMTRRVRAAVVVLAPAIVAGAGGSAGAHQVRVFAVNARLELRYADTYQNYRDKMFALVDARRPRREELVQAGVGDVASRLRPQDPAAPPDALVAFPEEIGLIAGLIGSRGAMARGIQTGGSTAAFIALLQAYQPQIDYYAQRYPGQGGISYLFLGATDTFYRAFYETFRDLARTYGVYVAASADVAAARRIEAATDPELVTLLRDPDEAGARDYAYVAVSPHVVNTLFVFAPDGEILVLDADGRTVRSPSETGGVLRGSLDKAYLTELEQSPLGLSSGAVRGLDVLDTPIGRIGSVTSKDAWMIDVNDRYDAKGAQLLLQAEAFDQWAFTADPWSPDNFKAGGFAQVQRNPQFRFNVTPCLVGNLYEVTFDGQGAIIGKRRKDGAPAPGPETAWIGQNPDGGFVRIAPWIAADPALQTPELTLAERRQLLAEAGRALLPDSGVACPVPFAPGACEDGYRESVITADLELPDADAPRVRSPAARAPTAFGATRFVELPAAGEQRHARVAAFDGRVYVAWEDSRSGAANVYLGASRDAGRTWEVQRVSDNPAGAVVELRPDLALRRDGARLFVVWQELCEGSNDDCGRIEVARFDADAKKLGADLRVDHGGDGAGKWNPAVAVDRRGDPMVVWVDERDLGPGGIPFEHVYFSRSRDRGRSMGPTVRVDAGPPDRLAASLDNKWAPSIAPLLNQVHIAWSDFRNYQWDIYTARSRNGVFFERNVRVDDAAGFERIDDHPSIAVDGEASVHVVWADRRDTQAETDIRHARSDRRGRVFRASVRVDSSEDSFDPDTDTPSNQWSPEMAVRGNDVFVVWQDNRLGDNDIFFARSRDRGDSFDRDERVDDSGSDPSDQFRPDIAVDPAVTASASLYVVWEDQRYGPAAVAVAHRDMEE